MNLLRLATALLFSAAVPVALAQSPTVTLTPQTHAKAVNPDTPLTLHFAQAPLVGTSGQVRIYDADRHHLVDTLDLRIPAGPDPSHRITPQIDPNPPTPTTTTPAVKSTPPDLRNYQLNTIGGLADFHFYPVIVHGNDATIYPHSHVLQYGHRYIVQIDPNVFGLDGFTSDTAWIFTTRANPPSRGAARITVAADGSGDFNTVQAAVDFVPDHPTHRTTIFIRNGTYEEIVFFQKKSNITFLGQDRDKVIVSYSNNSGFNQPMPGPSRRCAFSSYDSTGIELKNFTLKNTAFGQAEALLVYGSRNLVSGMTLIGSGDALNLRGSVYFADSRIVGDGDTILGVGPAFFRHCEIQSVGPFMWIRNTEANHGNVFVDCTFLARERSRPITAANRPPVSAVLARLPSNHGLNYPHAEAVLIRCHLQGIPPEGWGPIEADTANLHFWEFQSTDPNGAPIDVTQRHPASRQLKLPQDAKLLADHSKPAFILNGWNPAPRKP